MALIPITATVAIDEKELRFRFVRASGPGGQNVNKVATAVELRFDARNSPSLSDTLRRRLEEIAGRRMTRDGVIVIDARRYRTQEQNRRDAVDRLVALIGRAAVRRKSRVATRPGRAARARRLTGKRRRAETKRGRAPVDRAEE